MTSTLPPIVQAVSGSIGSASANALTYPLDLVTTRVQLQPQNHSSPGGLRGAIRILRDILGKHGLQHLYTGLGSDTGATLLSNFFYFYFYAGLRYLLTRRRLGIAPVKPNHPPHIHKPSLFEEILLGFIAGVASRAVSTPLNIVTLRLQIDRSSEDKAEQERGFTAVIKKIYSEEGPWGFWRGFQTTTLLSLNPAMTLALFQVFRRVLSKTTGRADPSPRQAFLGAAVSNSIVTIVLYPLILAKTRLQATSATSLSEVLRDAYLGRGRSLNISARGEEGGKHRRRPGIPALYQGLEMQILKGFFSQGVTFLVKGRVEQLIVAAFARRRIDGA
ncbi:mitochondrial carrier domain-containing protein [Roridomyces roridus]|uniref:Mitochondrial carrier domain-containing protein n=1 Tax=Roridomyces roridus TaxID=1738132 RepID=A0AAD7CI92_9AGAR|nr:mitochondrial carrier domain-containing protein [Roridomyces roridus]